MKLAMIAMLLAFVSTRGTAQPDESAGGYSRSAISIWSSHSRLIPSPDGKSAIVVLPPKDQDSDETHTVAVRANGRQYRTQIGAWVNAEAAWSPDSKAFFVTYSDGGNVGTYHVKVFFITNAGLRVIEPVVNGRKLFATTCFEPEDPNVGAIKWIGKDSSQLLIALEVPPHSNCASMGTFQAFQIALPSGKPVSQFDQITAKKLFGNHMGSELRNAEDACTQPANMQANWHGWLEVRSWWARACQLHFLPFARA